MHNVTKLDLKKLKKELLKRQREEKLAKQKTEIIQAHEKRDSDFFKEAMSGVNPITNDKAYHSVIKPISKSFRTHLSNNHDSEEFFVHDPLSDELEVREVDSSEILSFCRSGIQKNTFKKLRSGSYRISDELDLHGLTLKQAKKILLYYLQEAVQFEGCCVRIIHGKGHRSGHNKPVLKTHVNHWLSEHERVLAFHSTKPRDGGTGAVYVLLKTKFG